jgi:hypothetical protein
MSNALEIQVCVTDSAYPWGETSRGATKGGVGAEMAQVVLPWPTSLQNISTSFAQAVSIDGNKSRAPENKVIARVQFRSI